MTPRRWGALLLAVGAVHLLTLTVSPPIWQDEAQITELGRVSFFDPNTDWSPNWVRSGHAVETLSYVGPALQELALRTTGDSPVGPRLLSLLGALVAASVLLAWLRRRRVPQGAAWLLAAAFLLDPLFVASYRGARVDCWAFAWCLGGCLAARMAAATSSSRRRWAWLLLAGAATTTSVFAWASAAVLAPLVLTELWWVSRRDRKALPGMLVAVGAGGVAAAALLGLPILSHLGRLLSDVREASAAAGLVRLPGFGLVQNARALAAAVAMSPVVFGLAAAAALLRRNRTLAILSVCLLAYMLKSFVYVHRVLYLLPFVYAMLGEGSRVLRAVRWPRRKLAFRVAAVTLLSWAVAVSLVARTALAIVQRAGRDPAALLEVATREIGPGPKRVFLGVWEFYDAGRLLGWHMLAPYGAYSDAELEQLMSTADFAVIPSGSDPRRSELLEAGLHQRGGEVRISSERTVRLGAHPLGPYLVFTRDLGAAPAQ